ncbi:hypothetical protein FQR65_LT04428 [Abscondita terminalis]|nr:hypothetical protein FQR65_LT04428 [Abscondita terminalis]
MAPKNIAKMWSNEETHIKHQPDIKITKLEDEEKVDKDIVIPWSQRNCFCQDQLTIPGKVEYMPYKYGRSMSVSIYNVKVEGRNRSLSTADIPKPKQKAKSVASASHAGKPEKEDGNSSTYYKVLNYLRKWRHFKSPSQGYGPHEHPSLLDALHRVRMIILEKNLGILYSKTNTEEKIQEQYICATRTPSLLSNRQGNAILTLERV